MIPITVRHNLGSVATLWSIPETPYVHLRYDDVNLVLLKLHLMIHFSSSFFSTSWENNFVYWPLVVNMALFVNLLVPNVLQLLFLIVSLTTSVTSIEYWLQLVLSVQMFKPLIVIYARGNFWDVNQFIGHCLILLDSCLISLFYIKYFSMPRKV